MSQEKVINQTCQRTLYWLDYPLRVIETITNTKTQMIFILLYVNDYIIIDYNLFINTINVRKCIAILSILALPFCAKCFPTRPPPHVMSRGTIADKSFYRLDHSFPCVNVMNAIIVTRYLINTPMISAMVVLLTSLACVYCGTHFVSDTFFGYVFGTILVSGLEWMGF